MYVSLHASVRHISLIHTVMMRRGEKVPDICYNKLGMVEVRVNVPVRLNESEENKITLENTICKHAGKL